jgi:hypothetical protein
LEAVAPLIGLTDEIGDSSSFNEDNIHSLWAFSSLVFLFNVVVVVVVVVG